MACCARHPRVKTSLALTFTVLKNNVTANFRYSFLRPFCFCPFNTRVIALAYILVFISRSDTSLIYRIQRWCEILDFVPWSKFYLARGFMWPFVDLLDRKRRTLWIVCVKSSSGHERWNKDSYQTATASLV